MGQEINISILVDPEGIMDQINQRGGFKNPYHHPADMALFNDMHQLIHIVAQQQYVYHITEEGADLGIIADTGDTLVWNMTTFGNCADYSVYPYFHFFILLEGDPPVGLANASYLRETLGLLLPYEYIGPDIPECPLERVTNHRYKFSVDVVNVDQTIKYTMFFRIVENASGITMGYFSWRPIIKIAF